MICLNRNPILHRTAVMALGGGGARGISHFGGIQAVEEAGIEIVRFVGTSMGSLVAALAATAESTEEACEKSLAFLRSDAFTKRQQALFGAHPAPNLKPSHGMLAWYDRLRSYLWTQQLVHRVFRRQSILPGQVLEEVIASLVPDIDISQTKIPLSVVAVDLLSGQQVVLESGSLRRAIAASAAIPGIFPPVKWDNMLLCDVGVVDSLPARIANAYAAELVVGIDVGPQRSAIAGCESALHVLLRMDEIAEQMVRDASRQQVDLLIRPNVGDIEWFDFSDPERLVEAGRIAGRKALGYDALCRKEGRAMLEIGRQVVQ
ncbi:MAG: patatin-like phospholipase family protein [Pirellulaceae bacterium]